MKKAKIFITMLAFCVLHIASLRPVMADGFAEDQIPIDKGDILYYSEDYEEVKELESEIERDLSFLAGEQITLTEDDYKNVLKVYIDADVLRMGTGSQELIEARLAEASSKADYVWMLIYRDKYEVTIARGLPLSEKGASVLSEEEKQKITDKVGKWGINSYGEGHDLDYVSTITELEPDIQAYDRVVILGGEVAYRLPLALAFKDGTAKEVVLIETFVDYSESNESVKFDFDTAAEYSMNYVVEYGKYGGVAKSAASDGTGESNSINIALIVGIAAAAAGLCAFGIWKWRKKAS